MDMRPELQIAVMIRAMEQAVLPAVDAENRPAREQAGLVVAMLRLLQDRLPLAYRYERDELDRYVTLATDLLPLLAGSDRHAAPIAAALDAGSTVLARAGADPASLRERVLALRQAVGDLARAAPQSGSEPAAAIRRLILEAARVQTERERAWLMPVGFDPPSCGIAPIEAQLPEIGSD